MRGVMRTWIVCVGVACTGVALAAPRVDPREKYKQAAQLDDNGDAEKALVVIDEGLASAPRDLRLLGLKGTVLLKLRDYSGALAAYQAYIDAGAAGANLREAQKIVRDLSAVRSTFLELTVANGPAAIYLDSKAQGVFCSAAPSCTRPVLPGDYKVIAERPGFERWVGRITVENSNTAKLAITLVEKLSQLTVRVSPASAQVRVGDKDYSDAMMIAAGPHPVVVSLAGHASQQREVVAHEGQPVVLEVTLAPLVPVRVEPATATLRLDGGAIVAVQDGGVVLPPGKQVLIGRAQGFQDRRIEVPAERPEGYKLEVVLDRFVPPPPPPPPPPPSPFTPRRKIAIGAAGLGVVSAVLAGFAWDDKRTFDGFVQDATDPMNRADLQRRADLRATLAYIGSGIAAGAFITAAVLWVTGAPESRVAVTPRVGPVAGLDLAVRF